jgi:hypothetical protein
MEKVSSEGCAGGEESGLSKGFIRQDNNSEACVVVMYVDGNVECVGPAIDVIGEVVCGDVSALILTMKNLTCSEFSVFGCLRAFTRVAIAAIVRSTTGMFNRQMRADMVYVCSNYGMMSL